MARPQAGWVSLTSYRARKIMISFSNQSLDFVAAPALAPPEVELDPAMIAKYEDELKQAAAAPLPDEVSSTKVTRKMLTQNRMTPTSELVCHRFEGANMSGLQWIRGARRKIT
jgi:hypothetical protein